MNQRVPISASYPALAEYLDYPAHPQRLEGGISVQSRQTKAAECDRYPFISVVTVVRNAEKTLEQTIQSVLNQSYTDFEYIIVDGASTDGTLEIIQKYNDEVTYWISEPDRGIYDAMNKGIALSSGRWIHLLNADDRYCSTDALARISECLDETSTNYFTILWELPDGSQKPRVFPFSSWKLNILPYIAHPVLVVSRLQYTTLGLYDTQLKIASDHDFILRLVKQYPGKFVDIPFVAMTTGGFGSRNISLGHREFREVTIRHGFTPILAWIFYVFKVIYSRFVRWKVESMKTTR
jgi:glycosyltransferase involved in cell wall biosynthesis